MLLINCPWCGPRDETEFHYGSEAHIGYPEKPEELTDKQWAEYIFYRNNPKGWFAERWVHNVGCRRWFCLLYTSPSPRDGATSRMPSSA